MSTWRNQRISVRLGEGSENVKVLNGAVEEFENDLLLGEVLFAVSHAFVLDFLAYE